jgi:hypothetical protein
MDMKRLAIGTIAGAVTMYAVQYVMFDVATPDFYAANNAAASIYREVNLQWSIALGCLSLSALLAFVLVSRAGALTIGAGAVIGAIVGFLVWAGVDFIFYGYENRWNLTLTIVDPLLGAIQYAIVGAIIAAVLARVPKDAAIRPAE